MRIGRGIAVSLALFGLAACEPIDGHYYGHSDWGQGYGYSGGSIYQNAVHVSRPVYPSYPIVIRDRGYTHDRAATEAARREALLKAERRRQQERTARAERERDHARWQAERAKRERQFEEWRNARPSHPGRHSADDAARRRAEAQERRARGEADQARRRADRERRQQENIDRARWRERQSNRSRPGRGRGARGG